MFKQIALAIAFAGTFAIAAQAQTPSPEGAKVFFIEPANGAEISGPVTVKFGLSGMGVAPAGTEKKHTGHHHILINQKLESYEDSIPADETHKHFGGGQTEAKLDLPAGTHTLQLVLGDQNHIPHKPPVESEVITITVK
ncbi:MAG: DUF4399 domain-containing protein [Pseudomonadota bacterium]